MDQQLKQRLFGIATKHLLTQGVQSRNANGNCLYRGPNGLKCVVGAMINDEHYDPSFENERADHVKVLNAVCASQGVSLSDIGVHGERFLFKLQILHDDIDPEEWGRALSEMALDHGIAFIKPSVTETTQAKV
jgi:hypothetical protein